MTVKPETNSGLSLGFFFDRHHVEPRVKLCVPNEGSSLIPLQYIVVRLTNTTLDVLLESRIDVYGIVDGGHGRVSRSSHK